MTSFVCQPKVRDITVFLPRFCPIKPIILKLIILLALLLEVTLFSHSHIHVLIYSFLEINCHNRIHEMGYVNKNVKGSLVNIDNLLSRKDSFSLIPVAYENVFLIPYSFCYHLFQICAQLKGKRQFSQFQFVIL